MHRRRRCRGAVLLAALVPALLFGGGALLHRLETDGPSRRIEDERTRLALSRAKEALLGYAFSDSNRTGELPCPDLDGDGRLMLGVDFRGGRNVPCASLRGWLPFRSLGVEELRDGAGERLWYAVSDIHHAGHPAPLNSEVAGHLSVDGTGDVAAVVIAPGFPVDERQARARDEGASAPDARRLASAFLEGANADSAPERYATPGRPRSGMNDRLLAITRLELFAGVEKRVIGEVGLALAAFHREHGALPWLVPLGDPDADPPIATPGVRKGRLAFQRAGDLVETGVLRARWRLSGAVISSRGSVDEALLVAGDARFEQGPGRAGAPVCRFIRPEEIDCSASETVSVGCRGAGDTSAERRWRFRLIGERVATSAPDAARVRRRSVSVNGADSPGPIRDEHGVSIEVEDVALSGPHAGRVCGAGAVTDAGVAWGHVELSEVDHPLELGNELPAWFVDERWHALTYVAFAAPLAAPASPRPCEAGNDCLVLDGMSPADDKEALVVIAGTALPGQDRSAWRIESWYERHNATLTDDVFTVRGTPGEFNDQVRVVSLPRYAPNLVLPGGGPGLIPGRIGVPAPAPARESTLMEAGGIRSLPERSPSGRCPFCTVAPGAPRSMSGNSRSGL